MTGCALVGLSLALAAGSVGAQDLQQKVAAAKQAAAKNQQALRAYTWTETTQVVVKGDVKSTKVESCRYGPDGQVQKTPVSEPPPPEKQRGLKGKMIEKKTAELTDEMKSAVALVHQYLPPSPDRIEAAKAAGKITITPGAADSLRIADYLKPGDALTLTLVPAQGVKKIDVSTYLDTPEGGDPRRPDAGAGRRDELPGCDRPGHPVEQPPGPDREQQLPEGRAVGRRPAGISAVLGTAQIVPGSRAGPAEPRRSGGPSEPRDPVSTRRVTRGSFGYPVPSPA